MSVTPLTSHAEIGPYVSVAAVGLELNTWTAAIKEALVMKVPGGAGGSCGGEGGDGGDGGGGEGGGGDGGGLGGSGGEGGLLSGGEVVERPNIVTRVTGKGGEGGGASGGASWWMVTSVFVHPLQYARHVARPCGGEDESSE